MPMLTVKEVGKKGKLGLWHMSESLEELLKAKKISLADEAQLTSFTHDQRKKEWLTARILVAQLSGNSEVQIRYDEHNKPSLKDSPLHISLSHSHDLLAVMIDDKPTGIDIELVKPKIERIQHKFMSDAELRALQPEKREEQLTIYWCVKESLYKLYGKKELEFKRDLAVEPFTFSEKGIVKGKIKNGQSYPLVYETIVSGNDRYMLTYILND